ncbi:unnamed protein product [Acanthocheilonema viteae]|uniref:Uncharacterized protein n=1 Tax=Acanthocheilonema viteae TaxID=6277 RepID=A0A498SAM1_ACAVI|nr:unnamed protein product [Acanthocheilonema viteae]
MAESGRNKMEEAPSAEIKFDENTLEELLRENGLLPAAENVPIAGGQQVIGEEDRIHIIDVPLAEQALKALRIFTLPEPEELAEKGLASNDRQDRTPKEQEKPPASPVRSPIILRIKRNIFGVQEASICEQPVRKEAKREVDDATAARPDDMPSTSSECTSSIQQGDEATDEEKAFIDEILPLCGSFEPVDYTDPAWYYKLKKTIFLRAHELAEKNQNARSRGDELRKRNEELRSLHGSIILQDVTSEPQYSFDQIITDPNTDDLGPQFQVFPGASLEELNAQFPIFPDPSIEDLNAEFQLLSDPIAEHLNSEHQGLPHGSDKNLDPQQPKWF